MIAVELDQKIDVAPFRIEIAARRGAEQIEPAHMETAAQLLQFFTMQRDFLDHLGSGGEAISIARRRAIRQPSRGRFVAASSDNPAGALSRASEIEREE